MKRASATAGSRHLTRMLEQLARITDEPGKLTRTFLSPAMRRANRQVGEWMRDAGLVVREDVGGNLIGRLEGDGTLRKTVVLGSHLDTVRDAGRFDGAAGVLVAVAAVKELRRRQCVLPFALEVVGFSEEEGVRFSTAYLGSKAFTGKLRRRDLNVRDEEGLTAFDALRNFNGGRFSLPSAAHRSSGLAGYFEVHIEQGPVLERERLALGVVTAIAGQTRGRLTFSGQAGHAGTTPMTMRRDALAGAAEFILVTEALARRTTGLVATVGTVQVLPGAPNVIPATAQLSLDVRHARDAVRLRSVRALLAAAKKIARRRGLRCGWVPTQNEKAVTCSAGLTAILNESVRVVQKKSRSLVSGAGHDAVILSAVTPVAMLFVRCRAGLSHHPDEYASPADLAKSLRVTVDFVERLAKRLRR